MTLPYVLAFMFYLLFKLLVVSILSLLISIDFIIGVSSLMPYLIFGQSTSYRILLLFIFTFFPKRVAQVHIVHLF